MDCTDVSDPGGHGVDTGHSLNGEMKHDAARLAQSAIIKQDVMLSGTSTQSPVSSVLTMPTVNMPSVSMPTGCISTAAMATNLAAGALADSLFLGAVTGSDLANGLDTKDIVQGASLSHPALSQPQQLLGQPQVAPQLIITGSGLSPATTNQAQNGSSLGVQQLLIPVSAANGTQQLLSLPISLGGAGTGAGGQIQLLTTNSGQLLATNLAGLGGTNLVALQNQGNHGHSVAKSLVVVGPNLQNLSHSSPSAATQVLHHVAGAGTNSAAASGGNSAAQAAAAAASQLPQLVANAQGQIFAVGAPNQVKLLTNQVANQASAQSTLAVITNNNNSSSNHHSAHHHGNAAHHHQVISTTTAVNPHTLTPASPQNTAAAVVAVQPSVISNHGVATTTTVAIQQPVTSSTTNALSEDDELGQTTIPVTPNINQLLPNTISSAAEGTIVDGVNLDEIREFAKRFKIWRLSLGLTQTQVGQALSAREGPSYSQSAICRFEKLDITPKSAQKIKPVLERWMAEAEERYKNGMQNLSEFIGSEPSKKRKRRTSFTPQALEVLNEHFERNTHPSGAEMTELSEKLNYDREVIRVWFCNKRQALKNTIKKLKTEHSMVPS